MHAFWPAILGDSHDPLPVITWSAALMGALLLLFLGVSWLRRRFTSSQDEGDTGFTLSDLRRMHKEGKLTKEEYEKAKALIVERAKAAMERDQREEE